VMYLEHGNVLMNTLSFELKMMRIPGNDRFYMLVKLIYSTMLSVIDNLVAGRFSNHGKTL